MAFLEFFIEYCHREETDVNIRSRRNARYRTSIEKDQKPLLVYKNSLVVMNHFTTRLPNWSKAIFKRKQEVYNFIAKGPDLKILNDILYLIFKGL